MMGLREYIRSATGQREVKVEPLPSGLVFFITVAGVTPDETVTCNGQTLTTRDYPELARRLGATGPTFDVPDMRGRTQIGRGQHVANDTVGLNDGLAAASRTPAHTHSLPVHSHPGMTHVHGSPSHVHPGEQHRHNQTTHNHSTSAHSHGGQGTSGGPSANRTAATGGSNAADTVHRHQGGNYTFNNGGAGTSNNTNAGQTNLSGGVDTLATIPPDTGGPSTGSVTFAVGSDLGGTVDTGYLTGKWVMTTGRPASRRLRDV